MIVKKKVLIIVGIIIVLVIGICLVLFSGILNNDAKTFKNEYESLNGEKSKSGKEHPMVEIDSDNIVKYATIDEVVNIVEEGTGVIYFGYSDCPWCRNAVPVLLDAASSTSLDTIYYLDMKEVRDIKKLGKDNKIVIEYEGAKGYDKLLKALDEILEPYYLEDKEGNTYDTNEKRVYVPLVVFVLDGEIIDYHLDTVESQENPYEELNQEQYDELYEIYSEGIHEVLGDLCDERC